MQAFQGCRKRGVQINFKFTVICGSLVYSACISTFPSKTIISFLDLPIITEILTILVTLSTIRVLVQREVSSIWERILSNGVGVNGALFQCLIVYLLFSPRQTLPLFPTLGMPKQTQANSSAVGFFPALLFLLQRIRFS